MGNFKVDLKIKNILCKITKQAKYSSKLAAGSVVKRVKDMP